MTRSVTVNPAESYVRFFDTFTNESRSPLGVDVDFGGQLGFNLTRAAGSHQSATFATSSGDTAVTTADTWVVNDTPSVAGEIASTVPVGTSATVLGTAGRVHPDQRLPRRPVRQTAADQRRRSQRLRIHQPLQLAPGQTRSLVHFVATGLSEKEPLVKGGTVPAAGTQNAAVENTAKALTATPDLSGLTTGQLCSIQNWTEASIKAFKPELRGEPNASAKCRSTRPRRWSNSRNRRPTRPTT